MNPHLVDSFNSFFNLYQAILRKLDEGGRGGRNTSLVSVVIGLSTNSVRHRYIHPYQWRLSEIQKLAIYYKLSPGACIRLQEMLPTLLALTDIQHKELEKVCHLGKLRLNLKANTDWSVANLQKLRQGLTQWLNNQPVCEEV